MTLRIHHPTPDVAGGVSYWRSVPATVDGVLGGYGTGTLPRVDALGSRSFLLRVLPRLSSVDSAASRTRAATGAGKAEGQGQRRRTRALDVGAGVGRVSRDVLSHVVDDVVLVEPAENLLEEAHRTCASWPSFAKPTSAEPRKSAAFVLSTLQAFDLRRPELFKEVIWGTAGTEGEKEGEQGKGEQGFDVVWCQWMLQHLSDADLVRFLRSAREALVPASSSSSASASASASAASGAAEAEGKDGEVEAPREEKSILSGAGVIFVKENVCQENEDGSENVWWDEEDKSITRSKQAYERVFREAGLRIVRSEVQLGLPAELFAVHMWALV